jgi:cytochrome P450
MQWTRPDICENPVTDTPHPPQPALQPGDEYLLNLIFTPEGIADPAPWYKKLRDEAPVFESANGGIVVTRYEDCHMVLRDNRFGKGDRNTDGQSGLVGGDDSDELVAYRAEMSRRRNEGPKSMLFLNPPDHTRQRGLVSRAFTPRRIGALRASIAGLADDCARHLAEVGTGDAIDILGWLPVNVIGELVGVPRSDWERFRPLVSASVASLEPGASLDELVAAREAFEQMWSYFVDLVDVRRSNPTDDLISGLIEVEEAGDRLSTEELISTVILLFSAGMETTQNLIGNGIGALFKNPDQHHRLWTNPDLVPSAVDEVLRWDSPVQIDARLALDDVEIAGTSVKAGRTVMTLLGAANRDPAQFCDPDEFLIDRDEGPPMSFASGIHYCLGANLARAEGQEMFDALIRRFSSIEQAGELVQRGRVTLRGYETVPLEVTPR